LKRIGLISDTHGFLDPSVFIHFKDCDEIWHAGDFGSMELVNQLREGFLLMDKKPLIRGVYGNIDDKIIRAAFPEKIHFTCENVNVFMQHIGGYPGKYAPNVKKEIITNATKLFISGHSHILKIMYDESTHCLHINPGAAGKQGWHKIKTLIRFTIEDDDIKDCEVIEID
jgi:putative phosphoesterase